MLPSGLRSFGYRLAETSNDPPRGSDRSYWHGGREMILKRGTVWLARQTSSAR